MRIAITGTHFSGKSTLVMALSKQLSAYETVDEPYFLLEQEGYLFSHPPMLEDFEQMLGRSIRAIQESEDMTIFDRCPLDFLAYAQAIGGEDYSGVEEAIKMLDLIVYVPIEEPDRIAVPESEDLDLREEVDERLREMLFGVKVLEVRGSLEERVRLIIKKVAP